MALAPLIPIHAGNANSNHLGTQNTYRWRYRLRMFGRHHLFELQHGFPVQSDAFEDRRGKTDGSGSRRRNHEFIGDRRSAFPIVFRAGIAYGVIHEKIQVIRRVPRFIEQSGAGPKKSGVTD